MRGYSDFEKRAKEMGLWEQFSEYDLNMARNNPNVGFTLLNYKNDYRNATTPEARALANAGAERVRNQYGNYTAGTSGNGYYLQAPRPIGYHAGDKPTYQNNYQESIKKALSEVQNMPSFSYDAGSDDLYAQYKKQYTREGVRAQENALGSIAAASGGIPSSYAATATSQAGDYYASKLTDKIPELYKQAYDRYADEYRRKANNLNILQQAEQNEYNKYLNNLNQYNNDRNFGYGRYMDDIAHQRNEDNKVWQRAFDRANVGDYSGLNEIGIDTTNNPMEYEKRLKMAQLGASVGDFSGLRQLGIDTSKAGAYLMPRVGRGSSGARGLTEKQIYDRELQLALLAEERGDSSLINQLLGRYGAVLPQETGRSYSDAEEVRERAEEVMDRAESNNGIVVDPDEWKVLLEYYGENTLKENGIRFVPSNEIMKRAMENATRKPSIGTVKELSGAFDMFRK